VKESAYEGGMVLLVAVVSLAVDRRQKSTKSDRHGRHRSSIAFEQFLVVDRC
jgi:hypothetical protein